MIFNQVMCSFNAKEIGFLIYSFPRVSTIPRFMIYTVTYVPSVPSIPSFPCVPITCIPADTHSCSHPDGRHTELRSDSDDPHTRYNLSCILAPPILGYTHTWIMVQDIHTHTHILYSMTWCRILGSQQRSQQNSPLCMFICVNLF